MTKRLRAAALTVFLGLAVLGGGYLSWAWLAPLYPGDRIVDVAPGTTLRGFANQLYRQDVLPEPYTLVWLAHLTGRSRQLQAGEYRFANGINALELLDQVVNGRVVEYPLVFIDGWTFKQCLEALDAAPKLEHTLEGLDPKAVMARLGLPGVAPEGQFFPDTYFYTRGTTDVAILQRAYRRMQDLLQQDWAQRQPGLPLKTPYQALILASIIEKESGRPEEQPMIAGVFVNRLRKGMRLQTDPTVIYGLGDKYDGKLHRWDLEHDTPYNTYTRYGLPPTPIALPSSTALHAALHPASTAALYFVARGDGTHVFSDTLAEQDAAVIRYQLGGKAPAPEAGHADPPHRGRRQ